MKMYRVASGEDLLEALARAVPGLEGWVQAIGWVEEAEVRLASEGADPRRRLPGRWALVSLAGPAAGPYAATLSRAGEHGAEIVAGMLLKALSADVHVIAFAPKAIDEPADCGPSSPRSRPSGPPSVPAGASWAEIAAASAAAVASPDDEERPLERPKRGDLVHHFSFGLCEVLIVSGDRLTLRDAQGPGRIREILVDMLRIIGPSERDGKRLFKLVRKA
jgi:hypothetical protein